VDPALPRPGTGSPARATVTLRPLVTHVIVFDFLIGFSAGMTLFVICLSLGTPTGVSAAALLAGVVVWVASWLRTSIQFTASHLVVTMLLRPYRIPWAHIHDVSLREVYDHENGEAVNQRVQIRYRRDPGSQLDPVPSTLGEYRTWARTNFRKVSLPLLFPLPESESSRMSGPRKPRTSIGRRADRQRAIIREEFAARGYPLPGLQGVMHERGL
jgi:hypothetical protein